MNSVTGSEHSDSLVIRGARPLNAEARAADLVEFEITPERLVYCRNHGPVREFEECSYFLTIKTDDNTVLLRLSIPELRQQFDKSSVVAALQCAGNRRKEMAETKPVQGVLWADGVVANCSWGGIRLCDLLRRVPSVEDYAHVCFASYATLCEDDQYYGASIAIGTALGHSEDVLLAYEMNGETLNAQHGGPLRVVVPGHLGARWVKWVDTIVLSSRESPNFYQQRDYRILPPEVETKAAALPLWHKYPSMTALPLNSVIASVKRVPNKASGYDIHVKGYALAGPNGNVVSVQVSHDNGESWMDASIIYQQGRWSWTLWEVTVSSVSDTGTIYSRAKDESGFIQPRDCLWNLRGVAFNGWGVGRW
ncbi:unnamed protein product [Mycena citricolor]|uniref:Sulfite oxidase n=1 Tax=Mycena citricolor TaxID=2018698 RepID=A0AAD2JZ93_9AGAR|nr:unnamed protein product [Mycena citricolor]